MTRRIGVLGGSFDPIHFGHLAIAEDARISLGFDKVLFVLAAQQPFKRGQQVTAPEHRYAMVELACEDNLAFVPSRIELDRPGPSFTVTTLTQLAAEEQGELFFILGSDALRDLPRWHKAEQLVELAQIVAVGRPAAPIVHSELMAALPALEQRLTLLEGPNLAISSTMLRQRAMQGQSLRYLLPDRVLDYIETHQLYHVEQAGAHHVYKDR